MTDLLPFVVLFFLIMAIIGFRKKTKEKELLKIPFSKCREQSAEEIEIEIEELQRIGKRKAINYGCNVAGIQHHDLYLCSSQIQINSEIRLVHECNNPVDYFAVGIYFKNYMIGYIPAHESTRIAVRLKKGIKFQSHVESYYQNKEVMYSTLRVRIVEIATS